MGDVCLQLVGPLGWPIKKEIKMQTYSLNKVILIGRLGANPVGRSTKKGQSTCSFSIATNEKWKNKQGGWIEHVEWHSIVAWGALADFASSSLEKGQMVQIEGMLRTRSWEDSQKKTHKTTEILCSHIVPLESKE